MTLSQLDQLEEQVTTLERAVHRLELAVAALAGILWRRRCLSDDDWTAVYAASGAVPEGGEGTAAQ